MRKLLLALLICLSSCARLDYDAVGIHGDVVKGGQAQIDQGKIVQINEPGIWLAGHRTSHGAVFENLTRARIGDRVCVYSKCYTVTRIIDWPTHISPGYLGPLVLQTSLPGTHLLLVVAS